LPGGDLRNSNDAAASNIVNFRVATMTMAPKRRDFPVLKRARVSAHAKL
jgi:hypothetical protein